MINIGDKIKFTRADGVVAEDVVRDKFLYHEILEPYGRNRSYPALVLTEHSWCAEEDVITEYTEDEHLWECPACGAKNSEETDPYRCACCWHAHPYFCEE